MHKRLLNGELTVGTIFCLSFPMLITVDLKYDDCGVPTEWKDQYTACVPDSDEDPASWNFPNGTCPHLVDPAPEGYDWTTSKTHERYMRMRDALLSVNRTILYSLCDMGHADVNTWGNVTGNSWRITNDIWRELHVLRSLSRTDLAQRHGSVLQRSQTRTHSC
jgi:hypothetical protein